MKRFNVWYKFVSSGMYNVDAETREEALQLASVKASNDEPFDYVDDESTIPPSVCDYDDIVFERELDEELDWVGV